MSTESMTQKIADYFKTQPVLKAWLFGSFARGEQSADSDIDILVVYDRSQYIGLFKLGGEIIHKMEPAWEKVQESKFGLSSKIYQLPNSCSAGRFFDLKVQSVALQSLCESVAFSNQG